MIKGDNLTRFFSFVHFNLVTGCWDWCGEIGGHGKYAKIYVDKIYWRAYRYSYFLFVGAIPYGKEPDHLCRNRICVNPFHIEWVTHAENMRRARLKVCRKGHDAIYERPNGKRVCRECKNAKDREYYWQYKQEAV